MTLPPGAWIAPLLAAGCLAAAAAQDVRGVRHDPFALPGVLRAPATAATTATAPAQGGAAAAPAPPPWHPRLSAAIVGPRASMVLVDGVVVEIGQEIAGRKLVRVNEHSAVFVAKDGTTTEVRMDSAARAAAPP